MTRTTWISHLLHMLHFLSLVENAIKAVLMRNTYGLHAPLGVKIPAAVGVWRWEVRKASWTGIANKSQSSVTKLFVRNPSFLSSQSCCSGPIQTKKLTSFWWRIQVSCSYKLVLCGERRKTSSHSNRVEVILIGQRWQSRGWQDAGCT